MKLQGVLFDIDGTLIDSNDLHAQCWIEAFEHFGKQFEYSDIRQQIGKGGDLLVPDLLQAREMRKFGEAVKKYRADLYRRKYMPKARPFDFVAGLFEKLHRDGVKLALASSSDSDVVEYYTRLLGVGPFIEGSTSKEDASFSKPSPEIFQAALKRAGSDPERTLVVGDTPYDVLAAHRSALPVAAVLTGGFGREQLAKAEFLFENAGAVPEHYEQLDDYFEQL